MGHRQTLYSKIRRIIYPLACLFVCLPGAGIIYGKPPMADGRIELRIAVAANFAGTMQQIAALFERSTGNRLKISFGSSGKFYAQIKQGAPFDIFLAADEDYVQRLDSEGLVVKNSRFVYATGKLVLWYNKEDAGQSPELTLRNGNFKKISIANPALAPYGRAARETLEKMNLWAAVQDKLVTGENISQAFQYAFTGNVDLAFVSLSQIMQNGRIISGRAWIVDQSLHAPIRQSGAILIKSKHPREAAIFLQFLKSPEVKAILQGYGYDTP